MFEKRCTCAEIADVLATNEGATATLQLDGFGFAMVGVK